MYLSSSSIIFFVVTIISVTIYSRFPRPVLPDSNFLLKYFCQMKAFTIYLTWMPYCSINLLCENSILVVYDYNPGKN